MGANHSNLSAFKTDGTEVVPAISGSRGCTLANSTTYYIPIPADVAEKDIVSVYIQWAAAVAATFTIEVTDFPGGTAAGADVTDYSTTAGEWTQWNNAAYIPVVGSGNSASAATVTAGGSAAGSCVFELQAFASRRVRIKAVVTTGGLTRFASFGKALNRC